MYRITVTTAANDGSTTQHHGAYGTPYRDRAEGAANDLRALIGASAAPMMESGNPFRVSWRGNRRVVAVSEVTERAVAPGELVPTGHGHCEAL